MSEPRMLRPMEYGELFNEAFDLYKRNFVLFAGIGALVYVPYSLAAAFMTRYPIVAVLALLGLMIPMSAAGGAIVKALADRYLDREATIASAWRYVLRRLLPFLITAFMAFLLVAAGMVLFCVPGIIFAFWITFVWSVMIVEDRYFAAAIQRSRELAAGQWGRIFVIGLLTGVLMFGVSMTTSILSVFLQMWFVVRPGVPGGPGGPAQMPVAVLLIQGLFNAGLQTIIAPLTSLLSVLLYFDIRVRKEGFDIELLAQEMGEPPISGGPSLDRA